MNLEKTLIERCNKYEQLTKKALKNLRLVVQK